MKVNPILAVAVRAGGTVVRTAVRTILLASSVTACTGRRAIQLKCAAEC